MPAAPTSERFPRVHLVVLGAIFLVSAVAAWWPGVLLHSPLRCGMQIMIGIRCPFCGMTRDFVSIWHHSQPVNNPASWLVAVFIYGVYPLLLGWSWLNRRPEIFTSALSRRMLVVCLIVLGFVNNWHR